MEEGFPEYTDTNELFKGDLIIIGETPKTKSWKLLPLFKEGNIGETRVWQVGFDSEKETLKIVHGTLITSKGENGNLITATHPIEINKSGRTLQQQALLEARKRYLDHYSNGYLPAGENPPEELRVKGPMLAKTMKLSSSSEKSKSNETKIAKYPVSVMPKFDGVRGLSRLVNDEVIFRSRNNKPFDSPLTHIKKEISLFLKYLPPGSELDGELYSMDMGFDELSGVIRTKKTKHVKHDLVKYFIFDIIEPKNLHWEERYTLLVQAFHRYLEDSNPAKIFQIIQAYTVKSEKELLKYHDKFVTEGYEGIMVRRYGCIEVSKCCLSLLKKYDFEELCKKCKKGYDLSKYRPVRCNNLVKFKLFIDEEVKIVDFDKGVGTEEGAIEYIVEDPRGNVFKVRPRGTIEERRKLYEKGKSLIGKPLTIRYQELSEDKQIPRFPVAIGIRDYE